MKHLVWSNRRRMAPQRRLAWTGLITVLGLLLSMFPQVVGLPMPTASAHNLQTRMVYMFFDPATQACIDARMEGATLPAGCAPLPVDWAPGDPVLLAGDELGVIIKVVPRDGTTTGVGGHIDFYVPNGVEVTDVAYVVPDGAGGYTPVAMKGQSPIAIGAGPIGAKTTSQLIGLTDVYASTVSGLSSTAVNPTTGLHLGTIAGVYGDTGIFYATDPDTAYGSWQRFTGDSTANGCGSLAFNPTALGKTLVNNSGDTVVPCNKWDAEQLMAWGVKGGTFGQSAPIVDYADGRGNAPWGFASGVAGPQSGYAWNFDWDEWQASSKDAAAMRRAMDNNEIGPWQRIRYDGDRVSYDQPGLVSTVLGYASVDAGNLGISVADLSPTESQTDFASPKAIRWAVGQLTAYRPEYAWVKIAVTDATAGITNASGCPDLRGDTFGGDAGGTDSGKDHLWRYYEPTEVKMNLCVAAGKPATEELVKSGDVFQYPIKIYNLQSFTLTNVVVRDTLGSGLAFVSAVPAQDSGPNPLVWNVGTLDPGQKFESLVTVKATSSGFLDNCVVITSDQMPPQSACDTTVSGLYPYLVPSKTVRTANVAAGQSVIYDVLVKNIGEGATGNPVTISEFLPSGFTYDPSYAPVVHVNGALVALLPSQINYTNSSNPIFTVPSAINGGKQLTITFRALVSPSTSPGTYCNSYSVTQNGIPITTGSEACVKVAGGAIGDTVFRDWNGDGIQGDGNPANGNEGEEGIVGVEVCALPDGGCDTTDANGYYIIGGLTAGAYTVAVTDGTEPASHALTTGNDPTSVTLGEDEQRLNVDFGYKPTGAVTIGDKVFEDVWNDGLFDSIADSGIPNVTVWLYEDTDKDGVITAGVDALVATTASDANGDYSFTNLATGYDYLVRVDKTDPDIQTYFNGKYEPDPVPFQLSTLEMTRSQNLTVDDLDNDFGFWKVEPGSIGDQVFVDNDGDNLYGSGDTPLAGVTVWLYRDTDGDGVADTLTATTSSAADGTYLFDNLGPGIYTVLVNTADPDLPAGLYATVTQYTKILAAGEDYLSADFPFVSGLTKTVDKTYAPAGQQVKFSLKPYFAGSGLLTNVRVFDPLPTGTSYVAASANAGGTYGAYTPIPAEPGLDAEGGPLGNTQLDTAIAVSSNFVSTGGTVDVTLTVKQNSGNIVPNVSPTDLDISGGMAACSGPNPTIANVPTGTTGSSFAWVCTLTDASEYTFSAGADDGGDYTWPGAASASVLSAPDGGANVVTWSLGSNTDGVAGATQIGGTPSRVFALRGTNKTDFWAYDMAANSWSTKAVVLGAVEEGGALCSDGGSYLYALRGNGTKNFYRYDVAANAWSKMADAPANVSKGGALVHLNGYVYAFQGNDKLLFWRYDVASNTWATRANTPGTVKGGAGLTTDGTNLYALQGDARTGFWRYNVGSNTWTTLKVTPATVTDGGALVYLGGYIYALRGGKTNTFWRYDIATDTWATRANALAVVGAGGAITTDGTYIRAMGGNNTTNFWRYDPAANTWAARANTLLTVDGNGGGALAYVPGLNSQGLYTELTAVPTLVSTAGQSKVTLALKSEISVTDVVPGTLTASGVNGVTATCGSPVLKSADDDITGSADPVLYEWTCSVTPGTSIGSLTYSAAGGYGSVTAFSRQVGASSDDAEQRLDTNAVDLTSSDLELINDPTTSNQKVGMRFLNVTVPKGAKIDNAYVEFTNYPSTPPESGATTLWFHAQAADNPPTFTTTASNITARASTTAMVTWTMAAGTTWGNDGDKHQTPNLASVIQEVVNRTGWASGNAMVLLVSGSGERSAYAWDTSPANAAKLVIEYSTTLFPTATSNSVLVSPLLEYQVTVNAGAPSPIKNTGLLAEVSGNLGSIPSNTTETATDGSIGDFVWADTNGDGAQDAGELGLSGVKVYVDSNNNGVWDAGEPYDITDAMGLYRIYGLGAGNYAVLTDPTTYPAGYVPSTDQNLDVTLTAGQQVDDADFGLQPAGVGSIGDFVWLDEDADGVQDEGENGIPGVTVRLYRDLNADGVYDVGDDVLVATDVGGLYGFTGLPIAAGIYPAKYLVVVDDMSDVVSPYDGLSYDLVAAMNPTYDLDSGTTNPDGFTTVTLSNDVPDVTVADFGYSWSGSIGDYVWWDDNTNGQQDESRPIQGAIVLLYLDDNGDGILDPFSDVQVGFAMTDEFGAYSFDNLPPGDYLVDVYEDSLTTDGVRDVVPTTDNVHPVSLGAGETYQDADFGYYQGARVEGNVFFDEDHNGTFDDIENGLTPVTVYLCTAGASLCNDTNDIAWTTTDDEGHFFFLVPEGDYTLSYKTSETTTLGYPEATTDTSFTFHADPGEDWHPSFDFGVDNQGTVGDLVWNDANGDGVRDAGEPGIGGVTVTLYHDTDSNGVYSSGDKFFAATATDPDGAYLFTGLSDGRYFAIVDPTTLPAGYTQTGDPDQPNTPCTSCDDQGTATVTSGGSVLTMDFGYQPPTSAHTVSGKVWDDNGGGGGGMGNGLQDGAEPGIPGVTICLYDNSGAMLTCTTTGANGDYTFPGVADGIYVVKVDPTTLPSSAYSQTGDPDSVCPSAGCNSQTPITVSGTDVTDKDFGYLEVLGSISGTVCVGDGDGLCEPPDETGLPSVTVTLIYAGADGILGTTDDVSASTTTAANGDYAFDGTTIDPGNCTYDTMVYASCPLDAGLVPGLYQVVETTPADYISLADADGGNPDNISLVLALGANEVDQDFEDWRVYSGFIGDLVWWDINNDGEQGAGEPGIPDVTVELLQGGDVIDTTVTDASGLYSFTNLPDGDYTVRILSAEFNAGGTLENWTASPMDAVGVPDNLDSDGDPATNDVDVALADGEGTADVDFGFSIGSGYTVTKMLTSGSPSRLGLPVTFAISIENTGDTWIGVLSLVDTYDKLFLTYGVGPEFATPDTDDHWNDGELNWTDLTAAAPFGFGADIAPGETKVVQISFTARADTSDPLLNPDSPVTKNKVSVTNAVADPDGPDGPLPALAPLPAQSAEDAVSIYTPTGVILEWFDAAMLDGAMLVNWRTASEAGALGFNVLRRAEAEEAFAPVNMELILAQFAGQEQGAVYELRDEGLPPGVYVYRLEGIGLDGSAATLGEVTVTVQ